MNHQVSHTAQAKQEVLGQLKVAQSQKAFIERNREQTASKKSKKSKIKKKMSRLKKELTELKGSDELRKQRTGIRKVE